MLRAASPFESTAELAEAMTAAKLEDAKDETWLY
jgi:hypothetical protein